MNDNIKVSVSEQGSYTMDERNLRYNGDVTIIFSGLRNAHAFLAKISAVCDETRAILTKTPAPSHQVPTTTDSGIAQPKKQTSVKLFGPVPKVKNGRPSAWEYKFIKETLDIDDLIKAYRIKFPKTILETDEIKELWVYYHPKENKKREAETPTPRTEEDPKPGKQICVKSKVIQVKGNAMAPGIGTVMEIKKDGTCKVQFFNHVKVLPVDNFALATMDDLKRAKNGVA
jgi:hypothetical protein